MIAKDIIQRVFFIGTENDTGTGFTIEHDEKQYLISAKHIFEDFKHGSKVIIKVFHDSIWKSLELIGFVHPIESVDMIIFPLENDLSPRYKLKIGFSDMMVSQDVYFLGYPYGMFTDDSKSVNNRFPFPFVKKAVFSAFEHSELNGNIGYLDGHTNPGFSGGPIVYKDINTNETSIAGVMGGYVVHTGKIDYEEIDDDGEVSQEQFEYAENSGIIQFQNIEHFYDIIA